MQEPALGIIEFKSIAKGIWATDAIAKKAAVKILSSNPICPGKYLLMFAGEVAAVEESWQAGLAAGGDMVINNLFLPFVHRDIIPALTASTAIKEFGAIGIVESFSVASCIAAADKAAKISSAKIVSVRLANGLGGKAYFTMTGVLEDVETSITSAREHIQKEGLLAGWAVIPAPHKDLIEKGIYW